MTAHFLTLFLIAPLVLPHLLRYLALNVAPHFYVFSPEVVHAISNHAIREHKTTKGPDDLDNLMREVVTGLRAEYGERMVLPYEYRGKVGTWLFNVAGGATGQMHILHASLTEYLIIFGSATGTEGHSGSHVADDYFSILSGTQTASFLGELKPRVYQAGSQHHHPMGATAQYKLDNATWAIELAQGIIPAMLPFGLIQMPLSMDWDSLSRTVMLTGGNILGNLLRGKI